jgi:hypothetical protein
MKTKIIAKAIALGVLVCLFFAPTQVKAQVVNPYQIINNLPCKVQIRYTFFQWSPTGCDLPCAGPGGSGSISVPPSPPPTFIPIPASCPACGVRISIVAINGVAVLPPITAAFNVPPTPPNAMGPDPSGCSPSGNINLNVLPNAAHINP